MRWTMPVTGPAEAAAGGVTARAEAIRKGIHLLLSLVAAALVFALPPLQAATLLAGATLLALSVELGRRLGGGFGDLFRRYPGRLLREREAAGLTGATTLALGYTVTAVLFPGTAALAGILVAGVADAVAAVVGKRFGRLRYRGGKSLEGSMAFFIVVLPILAGLLPWGAGALLALALLLTLIEAPSLRIDDNLYLPVVAAGAVHLAALLPGLAVFP